MSNKIEWWTKIERLDRLWDRLLTIPVTGYSFILPIALALQPKLVPTLGHRSQPITNDPDGSILIRFDVSTWRELVTSILSWEARITIIEPEPLHIYIETELTNILGTVPLPCMESSLGDHP